MSTLNVPDAKAVTITVMPSTKTPWEMFSAGVWYGAGALTGACTIYTFTMALVALWKAFA